jgi:O-antigen/teichoic acid export membrane protein
MKALNKYREMSRPAKAAVWFVVCNIVNKGMSLLATPILTRIMTADQYGTFSVFQSWVAILTIFCTLNLNGNAYNRGRLHYEGREPEFESALLGLSTTLTLSVFLLFCIAPDFWSGLMLLSPFLVVLMFVEIALVSAYDFWAAQQRFDYRYRTLVIVTLAINVFSLGAGIIAILNTDAKVEARVVMDVIAKGVPGLACMALIFARGKCFFKGEYWRYGLTFTLPLLPHFLSHFVLNQSDRLMIGAMVGNWATALYSVSYSIAMCLTIVTDAINNSYVPYTFQELKAGRTEGVLRTGYLLLVLVGALCVLVMAFAPEILAVFAGPEYSNAIMVIPPLSASVFFIFLYSLLSNIEYYYEKTAVISAASIVAAALNIILNLIFIPIFGYIAAAWTTLAAYMTLSLMHWVFYHRICKEKMGRDLYKAHYLLLLSVAVLAVTFGMLAVYGIPAARYAVMATVLVGMWLKRDRILEIVRRRK